VLYEKYSDPSGYDEHKATATFRSYVVGEAIPHLAERSVRTFTTVE
jgi:quinol monooxygenase YgiN